MDHVFFPWSTCADIIFKKIPLLIDQSRIGFELFKTNTEHGEAQSSLRIQQQLHLHGSIHPEDTYIAVQPETSQKALSLAKDN